MTDCRIFSHLSGLVVGTWEGFGSTPTDVTRHRRPSAVVNGKTKRTLRRLPSVGMAAVGTFLEFEVHFSQF